MRAKRIKRRKNVNTIDSMIEMLADEGKRRTGLRRDRRVVISSGAIHGTMDVVASDRSREEEDSRVG